jgi:hypothetical protein
MKKGTAEPDNAPSQPSPRREQEPRSSQAGPDAPDGLRERVQRQRRHIEDLTGEDPLRGGVDD